CGRARYEERDVHEHMVVQGPTANLRNLLLHEDRRGLEHFIAKHNRYSTLEAIEIYRHRERWPGTWRFLNDRTARRRYVKYCIAPKLALPWMLRFFYMYFIRGGILDRRAGLTLSLMISTYELFIRAKFNELVRTEGRDPIGVVGLALREGTTEVPLAALSTLVPEPEVLKAIEAATAGRKDQLIETPPLTLTAPAEVVIPAPAAAMPPAKLAIGPQVATAEPESSRPRIQSSPWRKMDNLKRALWMFTRTVLFRPSFHNWYGWRRMVLCW